MAACLLLAGPLRAAITYSSSSTAPTVTGADIANLAGGFALTGGDEANWIFGLDRPSQGQTFTTGSNPAGYDLDAITIQRATGEQPAHPSGVRDDAEPAVLPGFPTTASERGEAGEFAPPAIAKASPPYRLPSASVLAPGTPVLWRERNIANLDLAAGPGGAGMRPDTRRLRFIEEEKGGFSKKYRGRDARGRVWVAKVSKEAQSETAASRPR